ncbi:MAG: undecaprenyldiphospho-muramoylpentapeptide beta-N-acetylglucosaminyltransferase [Deltaproteobacteria bacterium]|jgi:UDP-N-acetylglucosamine--N-acetylmuramyl-(pentapeptide) pyrophosphoryl-undecaprenol N-acetylglucosamine transferase|nr:undecaprenyldiphospho-muramoylpentapeptide beta-N-acetylglucosaminyltransferase [Deltaproteobacteria bacterium]
MLSKVILTGGGTGGHIFPALAVAEELLSRYPRVEILFLGGRYGPEASLVRKAGLDFVGLQVRGFFGRGLKAAGAGLLLLRGIWQSWNRIRRFNPDIAIGFGGYAAAAGLAAARLHGTPIMLHEQNSVPGIANRLFARVASRICISLPDAEKCFPAGSCILTGNPVRRNILALYRDKSRFSGTNASGRGRLLVLGGSQGARTLNDAVLEDLELLLGAGLDLWIQSGQGDYARVRELTAVCEEERVRVDAFIEDMDQAYAWADLVFCRAGATTLAELAVTGLPAILVPFPQATHNHQFFNAEQMRKVGAARIVEQKDLAPGRLADLTGALIRDRAALHSMSCSALLMAQPEAAGNLVEEADRIAVNFRSAGGNSGRS